MGTLKPARAVWACPKKAKDTLTNKKTSASVVAWGFLGEKWNVKQK